MPLPLTSTTATSRSSPSGDVAATTKSPPKVAPPADSSSTSGRHPREQRSQRRALGIQPLGLGPRAIDPTLSRRRGAPVPAHDLRSLSVGGSRPVLRSPIMTEEEQPPAEEPQAPPPRKVDRRR